jgi:5-phospho-D-xylono-1,4-lactonase
MSFVRTMLGDISPDDMGFTYSHEHIVCRPQHWVDHNQEDLLLDDPEKSKEDVLLFKNAGGRTIVDATAYDYGRDVPAVKKISEETGVQIIATAGLNKGILWDSHIPENPNLTYGQWIDQSSVEELTDFIVNEVTVGIQGTDVKGGQIKFGTSYNSITPLEIKTIRAAARAHHLTKAPIHSHTETGTMAFEQIQVLKEEGVNLEYVSFGHMDRNPDPYYHLKIADTGAFLSFDGIGKVKYGPESMRIACILELVKHGYQKQILISGDTARKSYYYSYKYGPGLAFIIEKWIPRFIDEADKAGFSGKQLVEDFFINNPKKCFTFKK